MTRFPPNTLPTGSSASRRPVRPGPLLAVGIGALVFGLVVWLAFWLGFERMRPDLGLDSAVALATTPEVAIGDETLGWELTDPGDPAAGRGPQYANTGTGELEICVLTWQVGTVSSGAVDADAARNDLEVTRAVLAAAGLPSEGGERVQVRTDEDATLELLFLPQHRDDGLDSVSASRAFLGSMHFVIISLICEPGADLSPQRMNAELGGLVVELDAIPPSG